MSPAIALKFLRDGVDSANTFGIFDIGGQKEYNFFKNELSTMVRASCEECDDWNPIGEHFITESFFLSSIGNSDLASYTQDGN